MPPKKAPVLPSPDGTTWNRTSSSSKKSEKTTASVRDTDYRDSLGYRNVYIQETWAPPELMHRAQKVISRPRDSPEMDDATAQGLTVSALKLQTASEGDIRDLASYMVPALHRVTDQRLARRPDQLWYKSVPLPLRRSVLPKLLPLPAPKPDLCFGYSREAFNENQSDTIGLLVDDQFARSFAKPDGALHFPFLDVEFKSQAKNGTQFIAKNQVAGAGAIALQGELELARRAFSANSFDLAEPRFFSVTMDHQFACVHVHWVSAPENGQRTFHVQGLATHVLEDPNAVRALVRAIKNILDYGLDSRLRRLCEALDAYREVVLAEGRSPSGRNEQIEQAGPSTERPSREPNQRNSQRLQQQEQQQAFEDQQAQDLPARRPEPRRRSQNQTYPEQSYQTATGGRSRDRMPQGTATRQRRTSRSRADDNARRNSPRRASSRLASRATRRY